MTDASLNELIRSVRPALADSTGEQRTQFLYDLVHEVYDFVKFDVYGATVDAPERARIADVLDAALPPV